MVSGTGIMGIGESSEKLPFLEPRPYVADDEFDQDNEEAISDRRLQRKKWKTWGWITATALLACLSAIISSYLTRLWDLRSFDSTCLHRSSRPCMRRCSRPCNFILTPVLAPLTNDLAITHHLARFNGSLLNENEYRQEAGPEVDTAWEALGVNCKLSRSRAEAAPDRI